MTHTLIKPGMQVVVHDWACLSHEWKQYRFPKSRKRRIRQKWSRQNKNFRFQLVDKCFTFEGKLFVSSRTFDKLKSQIPPPHE